MVVYIIPSLISKLGKQRVRSITYASDKSSDGFELIRINWRSELYPEQNISINTLLCILIKLGIKIAIFVLKINMWSRWWCLDQISLAGTKLEIVLKSNNAQI